VLQASKFRVLWASGRLGQVIREGVLEEVTFNLRRRRWSGIRLKETRETRHSKYKEKHIQRLGIGKSVGNCR
jgi:hypothetical protein